MAKIKNEVEYNAILERIEELLPLVHDETPVNNRRSIELSLLTDLIVEYEDIHSPI